MTPERYTRAQWLAETSATAVFRAARGSGAASATPATLVLAASALARVALVHVPASEPRPRRAIATAEAWARGLGTLADACAAADAALGLVFGDSPAHAAAQAAVHVTRGRGGSTACDVATAAAYAIEEAIGTLAPVHLELAGRLEVQRRLVRLARAWLPYRRDPR